MKKAKLDPYTTVYQIVPNMGWDTGLNLEIVNPSVTLQQIDTDSFHWIGKFKATMNTLIVKVRDIPGSRHNLGFIPEEGIFVLIPDWIFSEVAL